MSEVDSLTNYVMSKMSQMNQACFLVLVQYSSNLFDLGVGLPKIQAQWVIKQNLPN